MKNGCIVSFVVYSAMILGLLACSDMSTPADLDREQILAVRATPRTLVPGGSVVLETLLAGPQGQFRSETVWEILGDQSQLQIETLETGDLLIRADEDYSLENEVNVELRVAISNGESLWARKSIAVSQSEGTNPNIVAMRADGTLVANDGAFFAQTTTVELVVDAPEAVTVAWYSSIGEIRYYRDATTTLEFGEDDPRNGWLAVVIRDAEGGAAWHSCAVQRP